MGKFLERRRVEKDAKITEYSKIMPEQTVELYDTFLQKLKDSVYTVKLSAQAETLTKCRENFVQLAIEERCAVLMQILVFFQCNPVLSDLRFIGGAGHAGQITVSFDVTKQRGLTLVNQSITGFFEKEICLVPFEKS